MCEKVCYVLKRFFFNKEKTLFLRIKNTKKVYYVIYKGYKVQRTKTYTR